MTSTEFPIVGQMSLIDAITDTPPAPVALRDIQPLIPGLPGSFNATLIDAGERDTAWRRLCARRGHPAGCHNPWMDLTFCRCGEWRAPGDHVRLPILCPRCWEGAPCCKHTPCEAAS